MPGTVLASPLSPTCLQDSEQNELYTLVEEMDKKLQCVKDYEENKHGTDTSPPLLSPEYESSRPCQEPQSSRAGKNMGAGGTASGR